MSSHQRPNTDEPAPLSATIPPLVVVTDRTSAAHAGRDLATTVAAALDAGAPAILLRDKDLPRDERRGLAEQLRQATSKRGALLLVSSDVELAREVDADGVHLAASDPRPAGASVPLLVGRSCHDGAEVAAARDQGVHYAFVSPVAPTTTKPGYGPTLGTAGLRELVAHAGELPLLALGGVTPENAASWFAVGARGVAVMGGVMAAADPAGTVLRLLGASRDAGRGA